jgi:hypothetical protein
MDRWLGIDFSGNDLMWRRGCKRSNVRIADVRRDRDGLRLHDVCRVQHLAGSTQPFDRLAALLAAGQYEAAAIDAPFSVPDVFVRRTGGHSALLKRVGTASGVGRPFMKGSDMVKLIAGVVPPLTPPKPMRAADAFWSKLKINVRSPMWTGARPGAPMTAACLTLLHRAGRPLWPWSSVGSGLLVEAFPAGQLATWRLPHVKYDGASEAATATRATIIAALTLRVQLGSWTPTLLKSADALDAVLAAFGAVAVTTSKVQSSNGATVATEGWGGGASVEPRYPPENSAPAVGPFHPKSTAAKRT